MATLTATGQEKVRRGFEPGLPGFRYVSFGDPGAMEDAVGPKTAAILVEPIQGEGGVIMPPAGYLQELRKICDRHDLLLMLDEVQTGCGRTGTLFAYEQLECIPDVATLAKSLGNGVPIGTALAGPRAADALDLGAHGSTFGGNCVTCAAAITTIETLTDGRTLPRTRAAAARLRAGLERLRERHPREILDVRGLGLLLGVEIDGPARARAIGARALDLGLLLNVTAERVLRVAPPLIVSDAEIDEGLVLLEQALV
jgi:acetylornithine aminotransferase